MASAPDAIIKKKKSYDTKSAENFIKQVRDWTECFVEGQISAGIFLESIKDDTLTFLKRSGRVQEIEELLSFDEGPSEDEDSMEDVVEL